MADYDISEAFKAIENELIASMIRNLDRHRAEETSEGIQWSQWQVEQLNALEQYKRHNQKKFGKKFEDINRKISEVLHIMNEQGGFEQEQRILKAISKGFKNYHIADSTIQGEFFGVNYRKLEALITATTHDMERAETAVLRLANDQYRKAIFNAQVYANAGDTTYEKAVDMATRDMLRAGLNCIEYKNGARHTLSDYADMAIKTASTRAYLQGEGVKRQKWGVHTVILDKRTNPCPLCAPFAGKVFIDDVWSGGSKDGISNVTGVKYPLLSAAIKQGLYHPRCKDHHTTYFEGISTPPENSQYTKEELNELIHKQINEQKATQARNQAEKCERISKYSLDDENKRVYMTRAKQWREKEKSYSKSVANSTDGDIIKEKSKKAITTITDKTIRKVPIVEIEGYTNEQCAFIQQQHKELLKYSRDENYGKEVAFVFAGEFSNCKKFLGEDDNLEFGRGLYGKDLFVMHNHPRNSSYSDTDIVFLLTNDNVKSLSIVKNSGDIEVLTKSDLYDKQSLINDLKRQYKKYVRTGTDSEKDKAVFAWLKRNKEMITWNKNR